MSTLVYKTDDYIFIYTASPKRIDSARIQQGTAIEYTVIKENIQTFVIIIFFSIMLGSTSSKMDPLFLAIAS